MENSSKSGEALGWVRVAATIGGVYLGYRYVLKPLLETVGLKDDANDVVVKNYDSAPPNKNPFDPNYKWAYPPNGVSRFLLEPTYRDRAVKTLWDATGIFNDDEEAIYGVFRDLTYKTMVSDLAEAFFKKHQKDLYGYLKDYLSTSELATVLNIVNGKKAGFRLSNGIII